MWGIARVASDKVQELEETARETELGQFDGQTEDGEAGTEDAQDQPGSDLPTDLGGLIGRIGEAIEGAGTVISSANVRDFDPSSVPAEMLPTFYGFLLGLAQDSPQMMQEFASPDLKPRFSPDHWTVSPNLQHKGYFQNEHVTADDGTEIFYLTETVLQKDNDELMDIPWEVHFGRIDGRWLVTYFE